MTEVASRPILVTGGSGYVGAHACKALARAGYLPVVYDNLVHGHEAAVRWGPLERGEMADRDRLDAVIATYRPQAVMHFAAFIAVGESTADPGKYYRNNVGGTLTLLEAMRDAEIGRLVFSSTAAVYGTPDAVPIPEGAPLRPINPYGQTKLTAEAMIADFAAAHGISATIFRYFNAAGADPDGEIGECHEPETHLIPLALQAVTGEGTPLTIHGDNYPTSDGTCIRDFIHVADLADAHVRAIDRPPSPGTAMAYNLGTGKGESIRAVIEAVERASGRTVPHGFGPRRSGDPAELVSDPCKAMQALDWTPRHSDLDTIVASAWAWHCRRAV